VSQSNKKSRSTFVFYFHAISLQPKCPSCSLGHFVVGLRMAPHCARGLGSARSTRPTAARGLDSDLELDFEAEDQARDDTESSPTLIFTQTNNASDNPRHVRLHRNRATF